MAKHSRYIYRNGPNNKQTPTSITCVSHTLHQQIPFPDKSTVGQFETLAQRKFQLGVPAEWSEFKDMAAQWVIGTLNYWSWCAKGLMSLTPRRLR